MVEVELEVEAGPAERHIATSPAGEETTSMKPRIRITRLSVHVENALEILKTRVIPRMTDGQIMIRVVKTVRAHTIVTIPAYPRLLIHDAVMSVT